MIGTTDRELIFAFLLLVDSLSQEEIEAAHAGVTQPDISRWRRLKFSEIQAVKRRAISAALSNAGVVTPAQVREMAAEWRELYPEGKVVRRGRVQMPPEVFEGNDDTLEPVRAAARQVVFVLGLEAVEREVGSSGGVAQLAMDIARGMRMDARRIVEDFAAKKLNSARGATPDDSHEGSSSKSSR